MILVSEGSTELSTDSACGVKPSFPRTRACGDGGREIKFESIPLICVGSSRWSKLRTCPRARLIWLQKAEFEVAPAVMSNFQQSRVLRLTKESRRELVSKCDDSHSINRIVHCVGSKWKLCDIDVFPGLRPLVPWQACPAMRWCIMLQRSIYGIYRHADL